MADSLTSGTASPAKSRFRTPLFYSSLILCCVALYVVYVFYERYESNQRFERQTKAHQDAQRREDDLRAVEQLGGSELSIRGLYVSPALIHPGQSAQLCYDVANAKTVTLDPPVASVWPSHSRCIDVSPKKTTTYTLTIADSDGKMVSQSVELHVQ
jgi:Ca2+/Na+ antiporter